MANELTRSEINKLNKLIEDCSNPDELKLLLKEYKGFRFTAGTLGRIFEGLYVDKSTGFSKDVLMSELVNINPSFRTTNGGDWCRDGSSSYLGQKYNIRRIKKSGAIYSIKTDGKTKSTKIKNDIRKDILDYYKKINCVILDIGTNLECDHKDGIKDDWRLNDKSLQKLDDFQSLCKTANMAKKSHCKKCKETGIRYDAKKLGYSNSYTHGDENSKSCIGCYWYDPIEFNKTISKDYNKKD